MVNIDELRVTNDGLYLIIRAHVDTFIWDDGAIIDNVYVGTEEGFNDSTCPTLSDKNEQVLSPNSAARGSSIYIKVSKSELSFSFNYHIIFVYFHVSGNLLLPDCTPCGADERWWLGVTMYMGDIYNTFMSYIKEMNNNCQIPQGLIDQILRFKAVTNAIDSKHYQAGIDYYNRFFKEGTSANIAQVDCGCHG